MAASNNSGSTAIVDDSAPPTPSSAMPPISLTNAGATATGASSRPRSPLPRTSSHELSRQSSRRSRRSSQIASPSLRSLSSAYNDTSELLLGAGGGDSIRSSRDETAFYQAETAMLTRENQMLKMRIRELGKQALGIAVGQLQIGELLHRFGGFSLENDQDALTVTAHRAATAGSPTCP